jgi:hypothetical protein
MGNENQTNETVVNFGAEIKVLDETTKRVGGYLVLFGSPKATDLAGDFFTKETDFDVDGVIKSAVYFQHGFDGTLKQNVIGRGEIDEAKIDDTGVWIEAVLSARNEYEKYVAGLFELVKSAKLGWSSGTAAHLVEREYLPNGTAFVKRWVLGLDASLTPTPCEPRNQVLSLSSYKSLLDAPDPAQNDTQKIIKKLRVEFERLRFEGRL